MAEIPAIEMRGVSFSYNGVPVLENVSFTVSKGAFLSVVGPNGGGKTTLLKIILGLLKPDSGEVEIFGHPPEKAREHFGYMPQHTLFDPRFPVSIMDVVLMGLLRTGQSSFFGKDEKTGALAALETVGMAGFSRMDFSSLSGGQRQRVLLARSLVSDPEILLLDEPTANVDMEIENRLYSILQELNRRMTILMVTHDLGFVSGMVMSCLCVNRRVFVHPTCDIDDQLIREIYGSDLRMVRHDEISGGGSGTDG